MSTDKTCAVMVLYHPDSNLMTNVTVVLLEVDHLYLVDNSDGNGGVSYIGKVATNERITYIKNSENLGVAAALNIGLKEAYLKGYKFALLLDQDTKMLPSSVNKLASIYNAANKVKNVCMVGSAHKKGTNTEGMIKGNYNVVDSVITSGTLLNIRAYIILGVFDEKYFIDQVDHEYCLRALDHGYVNIISKEKLMEHNIGDPVVFSFMGLEFSVSNHSGLRRYYFTRNKIFLFKEYFFKQPVYTLSGLINVVKNSLFIMLFEADKREKLSCIFYGIKDGVLNISGKRIL